MDRPQAISCEDAARVSDAVQYVESQNKNENHLRQHAPRCSAAAAGGGGGFLVRVTDFVFDVNNTQSGYVQVYNSGVWVDGSAIRVREANGCLLDNWAYGTTGCYYFGQIEMGEFIVAYPIASTTQAGALYAGTNHQIGTGIKTFDAVGTASNVNNLTQGNVNDGFIVNPSASIFFDSAKWRVTQGDCDTPTDYWTIQTNSGSCWLSSPNYSGIYLSNTSSPNYGPGATDTTFTMNGVANAASNFGVRRSGSNTFGIGSFASVAFLGDESQVMTGYVHVIGNKIDGGTF